MNNGKVKFHLVKISKFQWNFSENHQDHVYEKVDFAEVLEIIYSQVLFQIIDPDASADVESLILISHKMYNIL